MDFRKWIPALVFVCALSAQQIRFVYNPFTKQLDMVGGVNLTGVVRTTQANTYTAGMKQTFASNATTAGAAFGGGITADPSSVSAGDFWYRADLGTFGFRNASAVDALVAGGRNLGTAGRVPFVSSAGVLNSDSVFFWDNTNKRLGVGTSSPSYSLDTTGDARFGPGGTTAASVSVYLNAGNDGVSNRTSAFEFQQNGTTIARLANFGTAGSATMFLDIPSNGVTWRQYSGFATRAQMFANGNFVLSGSPTDGNYRLDIAASGSSGTFRCGDQTATTGDTACVFKAGAANNISSQIVQIRSSGNALRAWFGVDANGARLTFANNSDSPRARVNENGLTAGSGSGLFFTSGDTNASVDLSLDRLTTGILRVSSTGTTSGGAIQWTTLAEPTCNATNRGVVVYVAGGAGVKDTFRMCAKDAADSYAYRTIY